MEVLNDNNRKRTLLAIFESDSEFAGLKDLLGDYYLFERCPLSEGMKKIKELCDSVSAIVVTKDFIEQGGEVKLSQIANDPKMSTLPVVLYVGSVVTDEHMKFLGVGIDDVISPLYKARLAHHILEKAIKLKDSTTFYEIEKMLRELPSLIYLKDSEGKYVFSTHYWHHLKQDGDPDWNIRGKTDIEIRKDKENAIMAQQKDMEILATGKGTAYTIEVNADGVQDFLEIIKQPVRDQKGNITGIIGLINNVTDKELLKRKLEEKTKTDQLTGLYNRNYFEQYTAELGKQDIFPVSFVSADCNRLKMINDTYGHIVGDEYLRMTALLFKVVLPESTKVFRVGGDEFIIVMPNTSAEQTKEQISRLKAEEKMFAIKENNVSISYGSYTMQNCFGCKQFDRCSNCVIMALEQADKEMYKNKRLFKQSLAI